MKGDRVVAPYFVAECRVTSDEDASVSSDQESFDGKVINHIKDSSLNDWHVVNKQRTSMRKLALCRTSSAPIKIPNSDRSLRHQEAVSKTCNSSPSTGRKKIVYNRDELLRFRYSPLSMTPPSNLDEILEATKPAKRRQKTKSTCKSRLECVEGAISSADSGNEETSVIQKDSEII